MRKGVATILPVGPPIRRVVEGQKESRDGRDQPVLWPRKSLDAMEG